MNTESTACLADILDSRPDTREMISSNLNLAHACLLLRRGEIDQVEPALELALRTGSVEAESIAICARAEVLRINGDSAGAWSMARTAVEVDRFNLVAALYMRFLFPWHNTADASALDQPSSAEIGTPGPVPAALPIVPESALDVASQAGLSDVSNLDSSHPAGQFPEVWQRIASDPQLRFVRLDTPTGQFCLNEEDVAAGVLAECVSAIAIRWLGSTGFGPFHHAMFEGDSAVVHAWSHKKINLLVVVEPPAAPALAARCSRILEDQT